MRMATRRGSCDWRFDSGRLCLDLVATGTGSPGTADPLDRPERLADWLTAAGAVRGAPCSRAWTTTGSCASGSCGPPWTGC